MKTASNLCLAAALVGGASSQRLLQKIPEVGLGPMVMAGGDTSGRFSFDEHGDDGSTMEQDLIEALEVDDQVTVVGSVELGELLCESLGKAEDAGALSFRILNDEKVIAEKTTYAFTAGDIFTDDVGRHVWTGVIIDPVQAEDEAVPRTVSMSWGEVCSVETFLLKVTKRNTDGTTNLIKTVPCDASGTFTCLVEVLLEFEESGEAVVPEDAAVRRRTTLSGAGAIRGGGTTSVDSRGTEDTDASGRRQMRGSTNTVIDVIILYSQEAMVALGGVSPAQMETTIVQSLAWTNTAFVNSEVALSFNAVYIGELPYAETTSDSAATLPMLREDEDVNNLRDLYGADLVQMISGEIVYCGRGYLFNSARYGYSVARATCLDNYSHTHEYGHNLGCNHDRESTTTNTQYAHGVRYCDGDSYRTIMAYSCPSNTPRINYFSNPDISYSDRVTGTPTENNARVLRDNMVAVSNYRGASTTTPSPVAAPTPAPEFSPTQAPITSHTPVPSRLVTPTPVALPSPAPSALSTPAPSAPDTPAPSDLATRTPLTPPTPTPSALDTPAPSDLPTRAPITPRTPVPSRLATPTPVGLPSPAPSALSTPAPSALDTPAPSELPTRAPITPHTPVPSWLVTPTPVGLPSPAPSALSTPSPTAPDTPAPSDLATPSPSGVATPAPQGSVTPISRTLSPAGPVASLTPGPVAAPSLAPLDAPTPGPVAAPTPTPVDAPSPGPVAAPSPAPSQPDSPAPSGMASTLPVALPSPAPSGSVTQAPLAFPSPGPFVDTPVPPPTDSISVPPSPTSTAYSDFGCYRDDADDRVLSGRFVKGDGDMTTENCALFCEGSAYFGTEYSNECFCGPSSDTPNRLGSTTCNFSCAGDAGQTCGGRNAISVYQYETVYEPKYPPVGCFKDDSGGRVLSGRSVKNDPTMTTEVCGTFCEGSPYFGTEYSNECFCGIGSDNPAELGGASCNFACAGNPSETCGGRNAISVYRYPDGPVTPSATYLGCWGDSQGGRIMDMVLSDSSMTNDVCASICALYPFYGTQYGIECWCGEQNTDHTLYGASSGCDYACTGDPSQTCGGFNAMSVWEF